MKKILKITSKTLLVLAIIFTSCNTEPKLMEKSMAGYTLGTTYHIKYLTPKDVDLRPSIDSIYKAIVKSMSTYDTKSDISRINRGEKNVVVDKMFIEVYKASKKICEETNGMFDPTIGIMVDLWGFGPKHKYVEVDKKMVKKMMKYVGIKKTGIRANNTFYKKYKQTILDFNAIAKGYTLDRVGAFFDNRGIKNYLIEIGGEILAKGYRIDGKSWRVGIDNPSNSGNQSRPLSAILDITDKAMATSGNYRNFRVDEFTGEKYVHTINAKTGMTSRSNMLSVSVMAKNCMLADGYATAFMAMGLKDTKSFLKKHTDVDVYAIYVDEEGVWRKFMTEEFTKYIEK